MDITMAEEHKIPFSEVFEVKGGSLWKAYDQLELYVNAGRPLIYIQSFDFAVVDAIVAKVVESYPEDMEIIEYVHGIGIVNFEGKEATDDSEEGKTLAALLRCYTDQKNGRLDKDVILLVKNVREELETQENQSLLRQIALVSMQEHGETTEHKVYVIIVNPEINIPIALERLIALVNLEAPNDEEIKSHLESVLKEQNLSLKNNDNEHWMAITANLRGLTMVEIDQVVSLIFADNVFLDSEEAQNKILDEKRQLIQKSGLLKIVEPDSAVQKMGGLDGLQQYLDEQAEIYRELTEFQTLDVGIPKGVLIVGMPGCGKTMAAKLAQFKFNAPLICLDIGRLMGRYVGQSEENMRRAFDMVESVAPCVLWIDELEKAFSGVVSGKGGGSEVATRLFGQFLTWMQEKQDSVYVIATANRINQLPPELLRRGRFDEIFRVDFPNFKEREKIFEYYLPKESSGKRKRKKVRPGSFNKKGKTEEEKVKISLQDNDYKELASCTDGYCGADIAAVVRNTLQKAFRKYVELENKQTIEVKFQDFFDEIQEMIPLKETLKDDIDEIRKVLDQYSFRNARGETKNHKKWKLKR